MRFVVEPGTFTFYVGASSANIRAEQVVLLKGEVVEHKQCAIQACRVRIS